MCKLNFFSKWKRHQEMPSVNVETARKTHCLNHASTVRGYVVSLQPNGFAVVRLDDNREAIFRRFDVLGTRVPMGEKIHEGSRIKALSVDDIDGVVHLKEVSLA